MVHEIQPGDRRTDGQRSLSIRVRFTVRNSKKSHRCILIHQWGRGIKKVGKHCSKLNLLPAFNKNIVASIFHKHIYTVP